MDPTNRSRHGADSTTVMRTMQFALHGLFVLLLVVGAVRAAQDPSHPIASVIGAVVLIAWYAVGIRAARSDDPRAGTGWFLILVLGWVALICLSPEFSWVAFALFFLSLHLLPRVPALGTVALITIAVVVAQIVDGTSNPAASVIGPCMGALVAVGISWIYAGLHAETAARQQLVDELIATQDAVADAQRQTGVLTERSRLARDIHDTLAQSFSSIVLLSRAGLAGEPDGDRLHDLMSQIDQVASSGLKDARIVVRALAPDELEQAPLPAALGRLLERLGRQSGIHTDLVVDGEPRPLPTTIEVALLRLAQGALANVQQHAQAPQVTLTITYQDDAVALDVVDNGVGFDPRVRVPATGGGFGLRAMRERLADLQGTLAVESAPGDGTAVSAGIPLHSVDVQEEST
ncbi:sensor histidine kinase [Leekyejoonella antrihumi]|uniref:Oxygen sensor histidine kinase NreB n=1 Tax=Leekyejoonella antrihumi TaxID=1660198 RepID=A0A563DVQ7_9MICO|nr:sensor histidine kinase [Leekyejoonella antrihumi]TWP34209.1 sensor histidine kinase [Leekyejoonella antrihumi]